MARLVFGMSQSIDGYVDDTAGTFPMGMPTPELFRHFIDHVAGNSGAIYGRKVYELMRYWDVDHADWDEPRREFAAAWRRIPKFVASRTLESAGPNATLIRGDLVSFVRDLKSSMDGTLDVAGPSVAAALMPLIDEYQVILQPHVLGAGKPFFQGARPPLRLVSTNRIGPEDVRLVYVPLSFSSRAVEETSTAGTELLQSS